MINPSEKIKTVYISYIQAVSASFFSLLNNLAGTNEIYEGYKYPAKIQGGYHMKNYLRNFWNDWQDRRSHKVHRQIKDRLFTNKMTLSSFGFLI